MNTDDNRAETRRRAEIMLAFADGAKIEAQPHGTVRWLPANCPEWLWNEGTYRVAPIKPRQCWADSLNYTPDAYTWDFPLQEDHKCTPMIELTAEVCAALDAAGVTYEKP